MGVRSPDEYLHIAAWHQGNARSTPEHVRRLQEKAARDGAPVDAVMEQYDITSGPTGHWYTLEDIGTDESRRVMAERLAQMGAILERDPE